MSGVEATSTCTSTTNLCHWRQQLYASATITLSCECDCCAARTCAYAVRQALRASLAACGENGEHATNTYDTSTPPSLTLRMQLFDVDTDTAVGGAPLAERVVESVDTTRDTLDVHCDAATARVPTSLLPIRAPETAIVDHERGLESVDPSGSLTTTPMTRSRTDIILFLFCRACPVCGCDSCGLSSPGGRSRRGREGVNAAARATDPTRLFATNISSSSSGGEESRAT